MSMPARALFARHALLPEGWRDDVLLEWDERGDLTGVQAAAVAPAGVPEARYVLPGMVNLHSHAFQLQRAGLAVGGAEVQVGQAALEEARHL
jgi:formimidoylglutamate deiminase